MAKYTITITDEKGEEMLTAEMETGRKEEVFDKELGALLLAKVASGIDPEAIITAAIATSGRI